MSHLSSKTPTAQPLGNPERHRVPSEWQEGPRRGAIEEHMRAREAKNGTLILVESQLDADQRALAVAHTSRPVKRGEVDELPLLSSTSKVNPAWYPLLGLSAYGVSSRPKTPYVVEFGLRDGF